MESKRKHRVLFLLSHPVQYAAPLFRLLALDERLEILVAYCSLQGAEPGKDPDFGVEVAWDVPLLDGYSWKLIPNRSPRPGIGSFLGLVNPGLWKLVRHGNFDAVVVYGYAYFSYWIALLSAMRTGVPILISADSVRLAHQRGGWWWKRWLKPPVIRFIFHRVADVVLVPSTLARRFIESLGVPPARIGFTHYTVDNDYFTRTSAEANPVAIRKSWGVAPEAVVVLFCAKLTPWKRPQDLLEAFAAICSEEPIQKEGALLVFAGDGPLRGELEARAEALRVQDRVRFLGFVNQSRLPGVYAASDLLVLPSAHEAWGLVVNEAMSCGVPAIVSDQVGAGFDLITPGVTGEIYPMGDVKELSAILRRLLADRNRVESMSRAARERMKTWSFREHVEGLIHAIEQAVNDRPR